MKLRLNISVTFIFFSFLLKSQTPIFNKTYDFTNLWENLYGIYEEDDSYYFTQHNVGVTYEDNALYFAKIDLNGDVIWNYSFCNDSSICKSTRGGIVKTENNTFLVHGNYRPRPDTLSDAMLFEFSSEGDSIQLRRYGGEGIQGFQYMRKHPEGGYILSGGNKAIDPAGDVYIVRLDENLDLLWEKTIVQEHFQNGYSIDFTQDGGYFVAGKSAISGGPAQIFAMKLNGIGELEWYKILGGDEDNDGRHNGIVLSDGNFLVAATKNDTDGGYNGYLVKLDSGGSELWEVDYSSNSNNLFYTNILELEDGSFVVAGGKYIFNTLYSRIVKFSSDGEPIWEQFYHGRIPIDCYFWGIKRANDGGFIGYGTAFGNDPITQQDGWIVKMDSEGQSCDDSPDCLLVNIAEVEASGEAQLTVSPNPANDQVLLYYYLPKVLSNCSIEVYDLNGRLVFSESHQQASQEYGVQLDVSAWPSGMYVVQLRSEEGVLASEKLIKR